MKQPRSFPDAENLRYWLALHRAPQIGSRRFRLLLDVFGSPRQVFEAGRSAWVAARLPEKTMAWLGAPNWKAVDDDLLWAGGMNRFCLTPGHPQYPALLAEIHDPPAVLFVEGNLDALGQTSIAMVGSRSPTPTGQRIATSFGADLARQGVTVVSGLAAGIDAASHQGALEGGGLTVAVAGTGPDQVYPRQHQFLAARIVEQGVLVTEYPVGTGPVPTNFPRRNRIISGLALGTLVVEAAPRSGSLITARLALEQNRDVFAVPGSIYNVQSRGCNELIQQGAKLVLSTTDILEEYGLMHVGGGELAFSSGSAPPLQSDSVLLKYIAYEPVTVDTLIVATSLSAESVAAELLVLELEGLIASQPGGGYIRVG